MSNIRYEDVEPTFIGLIRLKAISWSRKGVGEVDDLIQEGRIHAMRCVASYDADRQGLPNYVGFVLDNEYRNMAASAFALKRVPRVWTCDDATGEWTKEPQRPSSLDAPAFKDGNGPLLDSIPADGLQGMDPDQAAEWTEEEADARAFITILMSRLNKRQRRVLRAMVSPDWGLYAMVRNLTGSSSVFKVTKRHIALYLDLTYGQVENDAATIRRAAKVLLQERGYAI